MTTKDGQKVHFNPLENKVPEFEKILGDMLDALLVILTVVCRFFADITDFCILILSKTIFRFAKEPTEHEKHYVSYSFGNFVDKHSKGTKRSRHAETYVRVSETLFKTTDRISRGFSFALLMTCLGICLVLVFLLVFKYLH